MSEDTKAPKTPKRGVGTVIKEQLRAGATNEAALAAVKVEFPEAQTTLATVSWYRTNLRSTGETVPSAREVKKAAKAAEAPAETPAADPLED